jgi:hypothetical protein
MEYFQQIQQKINDINKPFCDIESEKKPVKQFTSEKTSHQWGEISDSRLKSLLYEEHKKSKTKKERVSKKISIVEYLDDSLETIDTNIKKKLAQKPWTKLTPEEKQQCVKIYCKSKTLDENHYLDLLKKRKITKNQIEFNEEKCEIINIIVK